jgi:diguanylate cyclase (GGDEF)-like protein
MKSTDSPSRENFRTRLTAWVLGAPGDQRVRVAYSLLAWVVYAVFAGVQQLEVWYGLVDQTESNRLSLYSVTGAAGFFAFMRSGHNQRFHKDPSLSFAHCLFGVTAICFSYAITGPARGGIMAILLLILVFAMFAMKPRQIYQLSVCAGALLGGVMVWKAVTDPVRYAAHVEVTHALVAVILIGLISVLASRMGAMRALLQRQKTELEHALEQNRHLATLDELTGLINRRHAGAQLRAEHERQKRSGEAMSIAIVDIDSFKRVNDQYGHAAGDQVLREFAQVAARTLRTCDTAARWGGEEFLVLMPRTRSQDALLAIERIREAFAQLRFPSIDSALRITFSAGIATHTTGESIEHFVERADRCMYAAKTSGRNRVCTDLLPKGPPPPRVQALQNASFDF